MQLEDALESIFNNNNAAAANTATPSQVRVSSIKRNKPQAFTGDKKSPKADTWCFQLKVYFEVAQVPPEKQVSTAVTFLHESAELSRMEHVNQSRALRCGAPSTHGTKTPSTSTSSPPRN